MPYTPPSQRSPAGSSPQSPNLSRRSSYQAGQTPSSQPAKSELPRSTSYLTRHRRTPSNRSTSTDTPEQTPPGSADKEVSDISSLVSTRSLRQSPPPITDDSQIPVGAVISPPDSANCSSDDEDAKESRGRRLENLAELQAAIRTIEQHRASSPEKTPTDVGRQSQALTVVVPTEASRSSLAGPEQVRPQGTRRIVHSRASTESSVFLDLRHTGSPDTPLTGSEEEEEASDDDDDDDDERSGRKPPMLRKKSGELVRPALRASSARRRPSSMPGTPTFSKAVHFDSHLEHVRHFLQVDRPLAVSAGSSPVDSYDSDSEFPFGSDDSHGGRRSPPWEWEIVISNFPPNTPLRLRQPVRVERVFLSGDNKTLVGNVAVANLAFSKLVVARFTLDYWKTTSEVVAEYNNDVRQQKLNDGYDRFNFNIKLADLANLEAKTMFFCVKFVVNGQEYWDNNNFTNFQVDFRKKPIPQNGKRGAQGAASRPLNAALPRSNKKPVSPRPKAIPLAFDDFADGFDSKYNFEHFKQPVNDLLGEANPSVRLKGVRSAVTLSDSRRPTAVHHAQAFGHRYDFGASLNAAIQSSNSSLGDRGGLVMKPSSKRQQPGKVISDAPVTASPVAMTSRDGPKNLPNQPSAPAPGTGLASQSYNELLDKYCFFGSVKSSPQLKDGTMKSGQYDGANDDGYGLGDSETSTANSSPLMMEKKSPPRTQSSTSQATRSTSPAPMTGFVTGTSPMYPYQMHHGFPLHEAHSATAIRG